MPKNVWHVVFAVESSSSIEIPTRVGNLSPFLPLLLYVLYLISVNHCSLLYVSLHLASPTYSWCAQYYHEIYRIRLNSWFLNTLGVIDPYIFSLVYVKNHYTPVNCIKCLLQYSLCLIFTSTLASSFGSLPSSLLFTISFFIFAKEY